MPSEKEQILKEYGLSDNEIKVYLASLYLGNSKVHDIAKRANLLRTTAYEILKVLINKGLASYVIKSNVRHFEAADPKELINILEEKKRKVKTILPQLQAIKKATIEKPSITVFEGKAGLKTILDQVINDKPYELLQLSSADILETLEFYFPHWIKRRIKNKIRTRIINQKTTKMIKYKKEGKLKLREVRFLPKSFKITTSNFIFNNKIAMMTMKRGEIIGVMIENKEIVETEKSQFEFIWRNSCEN